MAVCVVHCLYICDGKRDYDIKKNLKGSEQLENNAKHMKANKHKEASEWRMLREKHVRQKWEHELIGEESYLSTYI